MKRSLIEKWSIKRRIVASVLVLLLIAFSILHLQSSLTFVAGDNIAYLTNDISGELIEPAFSFRTNGQTTRLYFFDGYLIWASSYCSYSGPPITTQQGGVTVTTYPSYVWGEDDAYPSKTSDIHTHYHSDPKVDFLIPDVRLGLRMKFFSQETPKGYSQVLL